MKKSRKTVLFMLLLMLGVLVLNSAAAQLSANVEVDLQRGTINIGGPSTVYVDLSWVGGTVTSKLEVFHGTTLEHESEITEPMSDFRFIGWKATLNNTKVGYHTFKFTVTSTTGNGSSAVAYDTIYISANGMSSAEPTPTPTTAPTAAPTAVPTATPTTTPEITPPGDANGDGKVDIMDLVSIIDYIVSDTESDSMHNADANGDGKVDIMDLVWIIDLIVSG